MDEPPPVPPKDSTHLVSMSSDPLASAPTSASKRKRNPDDVDVDIDVAGTSTASDRDSHTPKRSRRASRKDEEDISTDDTPAQQHNVRRKKGIHNLSNLNLRHAAQKHAQKQGPTRESKFQEGSLTDKPSEKPPSVFTRMMRTDSDQLLEVDTLMDNYHEQVRTQAGSNVKSDNARDGQPPIDQKEENAGFFRFGRQLAQNFHPVNLWNRMWTETKDDLTRQNLDAAERKARQKVEAEAKYAEMKQAGLFKFQPAGTLRPSGHASAVDLKTPRDSGVFVGPTPSTGLHTRSVSATSHDEELVRHSGGDWPDKPTKTTKDLRSRLHFKTPSLSNIRDGLKRVASDLNLSANIPRDPSSSASPNKTDADDPTLRQSHARFDPKKQYKLTKRVSDLEYKLQQARLELEEALVDASPMPKLNNRYERFTPFNTLRRSKFVPGRLPSLPSERILEADGVALNFDSESASEAAVELSEPQHQIASDRASEGEDEETIKARAQPPPRPALDSIFISPNNNVNTESPSLSSSEFGSSDGQPEQRSSTEQVFEAMENQTTASHTSAMAAAQAETNYANLDSKLQALEQNMKLAKKSSKPKKRKSIIPEGDRLFKPDEASEDDAEWEKSGRAAKKTRKGTSAAKNSPRGKKGNSTRAPKHDSAMEVSADAETHDEGMMQVTNNRPAEHGQIINEGELSHRSSLELQGHQLEPLIEEEEDVLIESTTTTVPLRDTSSRPTAQATPARYTHNFHATPIGTLKRSHSLEPHTQPDNNPNGSKRTRARSKSPPPKRRGRIAVSEDDTFTAVPGVDGVPDLPKSVGSNLENLSVAEVEAMAQLKGQQTLAKEEFVWPEDVF